MTYVNMSGGSTPVERDRFEATAELTTRTYAFCRIQEKLNRAHGRFHQQVVMLSVAQLIMDIAFIVRLWHR